MQKGKKATEDKRHRKDQRQLFLCILHRTGDISGISCM